MKRLLQQTLEKCREYLAEASKNPNLGSNEVWPIGPTKQEILSTPLELFPAYGFPIIKARALQNLEGLKSKLATAVNPKGSLAHIISQSEKKLGIRTGEEVHGSDPLEQLKSTIAGQISFELPRRIYDEMMAFSDTPLEMVLRSIEYLPSDCSEWEQDNTAWENLYEYLEYYVEEIYFSEGAKAMLSDLEKKGNDTFLLEQENNIGQTADSNEEQSDELNKAIYAKQRWVWTGTPGEAVKAITMFNENGYLPLPSSKMGQARTICNTFLITSQTGREVTVETIRDIIGRNEMPTLPGEWRIPPSRNNPLHKDK